MTLKGGNRDRGERVFYRNNSAQCIRCQKIGGEGGEELLISLIDPSTRIAPGYGTVEVELKDGRKIVGILQAEKNGILTLNPPSDEPIEVSEIDIKSRQNYPSGMFSMKGILGKEEIRDLVEYLGGLR